jgi:hypothetical protein
MPRSRRSAFPDAAPSAATLKMQAAAARLFQASATLRSKAINAGQIADYLDWQQPLWNGRPNILGRREELWELMAARLDPGRPLVALEFGVAWGYATDWWVRRLAGRALTWHGFDRFTGLPRSWREHDAGAFDAGGEPPAIDDARIVWHIGDVEDTIASVDLAAAREAQWLILFDLDIYEPTAVAWRALAPHLRAGDLLYLDEAMDSDERRVLDEMILPTIDCEPVGTTSLALGLDVTRAAG